MIFLGCLLLLSLQGFVQASHFLDIHLKAHTPFTICNDIDRCNISYTVVLLRSDNHRNFQSLSLQEPSFLRKTHDETYEEETIIGLTPSILETHGRIFVGVQLYDLPVDSQDFYLVDVTNTIHDGSRAKVMSTSGDLSLSTVVHRRHESGSVHRSALSHHNGCNCITKNCGCCAHLLVRKIHLNDNACWNITYISEDIGLKVSFSVNDHIYISREISVRNPPPFCFDVPHLRQFAALCLKLFNVETSRTEVTGCADLEAHLYHFKIAELKLGCFRIPI
uniref:DUF4773 domain-containing protein n=1 Tax=Steinernema glaseri TaxID=37863 RepID=A0A1I8AN11_9BILA